MSERGLDVRMGSLAPGGGSPSRASRDKALLVATRTARGFGAGALSIVLALDLAAEGYSSLTIGALLGVALGSAATWSLSVPSMEHRIGRRRVFYLTATAFAAGGFLLWTGLANPLLLVLALLLGGIIVGTSDVSPLGALEQATLARACEESSRTRAFVEYNVLGYVGGALGALAAAPIRGFSTGPFTSGLHDSTLLLYGLLGLGLIPAYRGLSPQIGRRDPSGTSRGLSPQARPAIVALTALFSVDAFGGGLIVNAIVVYYFSLRFAPPVAQLSFVFFLANLGAGLSLLFALPLARRIGLVRTMVFTHLPSSVLLVAFPFAPSLLLANGIWVARSLLSQMDVPTRQSYVQAVVPASYRDAAAGLTTAARSSQALGGPVTGALLAAGGPWLAAPFLLAGSVKIAYDLALFERFRDVRPPEETLQRPRLS